MIGEVHAQIENGKLDPHRPAAIQAYMTQDEWECLVDDLSEAVEAGVRFNATFGSIGVMLPLLMLVAFIAAPFVLGPNSYLAFLAFLAFLILFVAFQLCGYAYRTCHVGPIVEQQVDAVLKRYNDRSSSCSINNKGGGSSSGPLSFHLLQGSGMWGLNEPRNGGFGGRGRRRGGTDFVPVDFVLQISVDQEMGQHYSYTRMEDGSSSPRVRNNNNNHNNNNKPEELKDRLEQLERAKQYLSHEEYTQKRQEILQRF